MTLTLRQRCDEIGECWEWRTNAKTEHAKRHPSIHLGGKMMLVRRLAYEAQHGELAEGRYLRPTCGNLRCVFPGHQCVITGKQRNKLGGQRAANSPTRAAKVSRTRRANGRNKLTAELVEMIRLSDEPATTLGPRLNVDDSTVTLARRGKTWKDYTPSPFTGLGSRT